MVLVALELLFVFDLCSLSKSVLCHLMLEQADTSNLSPLASPMYLNKHARPHATGISVTTPPVCSRCSDDPSSLRKLQQHAIVLRIPPSAPLTSDPSLDDTTTRTSLYRPLDTVPGHGPEQSSYESSGLRPPRWMELLPSHRNPLVKPPTYSVLQRRNTFPYFQTTRHSTPFSTPPEYPRLDRQDRKSFRVPSSFELPGPTTDSQSPTSLWKRASAPSQNQRAYKPLPAPNQSPNPKPTPLQPLPLRKPKIPPPVPPPFRNRQPTTPSPPSPSTCQSPTHSPLPSQEIIPTPAPSSSSYQPPFLKELSGFLASRAGKWILPSRVGQVREQRQSQMDDHVHDDGRGGRASRK